ncbi:hypothetical protein [Uliginosibacterium sp. TH139]|uniref:hypothetical protein n=1 Tax=Uliginosibacterium sp. TH139 TaxID=2067453 RepID=UPI0011803D96|nr:hypothetical protein [Uliginosibacterium sp. TH139]
MSTKLAKARLAAGSARQSANDARAANKPLQSENRKLRKALLEISERYPDSGPAEIALKALGLVSELPNL